MRITINMKDKDFKDLKNLLESKKAIKTLMDQDQDLIEIEVLKEAFEKCMNDIYTYTMDLEPIGLILEGIENAIN